MTDIIDRLKGFLSRKVYFGTLGFVAFGYLPVWFKKHDIGEMVTLASIGGITLIVGYYFKVNVDAKG